MKNSTKFTVIGVSNGIAYLRKVGGGFTAFADGAEYIGVAGDVVEVAEKDYTPHGDASAYQAMSDRYNANDREGDGNKSCLDGQN